MLALLNRYCFREKSTFERSNFAVSRIPELVKLRQHFQSKSQLNQQNNQLKYISDLISKHEMSNRQLI